MLDFILFWFVTSADYYSVMKDEYHTLYVSSSCFSYQYNSLIQMSIGWKIYTTLYINFPLVNHRLKTKKDKGDIENNNVSTFFTNILVLETKKEKIADILCYLFRYSGLLLLNIIIYE